MDDVGAFQLHRHRHADRDVDLVGGGEGEVRLVAEIADLPPPLVARDLDSECGLSGRLAHGGERDHGPHRRREQHHGRDGDADIDPAQAAHGTFDWKPPRGVADRSRRREQGAHEQRTDDDDDDDGDDHQPPGQGEHFVRLGAEGPEIGHRRLGMSRQGRRGGRCRQC